MAPIQVTTKSGYSITVTTDADGDTKIKMTKDGREYQTHRPMSPHVTTQVYLAWKESRGEVLDEPPLSEQRPSGGSRNIYRAGQGADEFPDDIIVTGKFIRIGDEQFDFDTLQLGPADNVLARAFQDALWQLCGGTSWSTSSTSPELA